MSYNKMRNAMLMMAGLQSSNYGVATTGIVVALDNVNNLVQVRISDAYSDQPALQTGWMPIATPWSGNGFGFFAPPNYNDLVLLIFADGDTQNPVCAMRIFNDEDLPLNVPSGELWIVHKSGSFLKLTNDGKLLLNGNLEIDLTTPTVHITCTTKCTINSPTIELDASTSAKVGNISGTLYKLINDTFINLYNNHIHPTPSGNSSPPVISMTSANATTIMEAN